MQYMKDGKCFLCGKKGHTSRECEETTQKYRQENSVAVTSETQRKIQKIGSVDDDEDAQTLSGKE
jgi:collagenase-like PrtC family protease